MRIHGSVAIVTGASSGIGSETALLLARKGARVWAVARSHGPLHELAAEHGNITAFPADVTSREDRESLLQEVGPVDVLVNNAGIGWTGLVEQMTEDEARELFEVNVLAPIDLARRVVPGMLERRRGHVVNVSSIASWVSVPPLTVYSATKFALQGFSDGLRRELSGRGVSVTSVNPGPIATRFAARAKTSNRPSGEMSDERMPGIPTSTVARAILRAIRVGSAVPGYGTIAVPRVAGLARVGAVPGLQLAVDGVARVARTAPAWRRARATF